VSWNCSVGKVGCFSGSEIRGQTKTTEDENFRGVTHSTLFGHQFSPITLVNIHIIKYRVCTHPCYSVSGECPGLASSAPPDH
jgi:hypothetical protein